jgi:hypothetical protein
MVGYYMLFANRWGDSEGTYVLDALISTKFVQHQQLFSRRLVKKQQNRLCQFLLMDVQEFTILIQDYY